MRLDSLCHLAVIDPDTASRAGTVIDYWVDPSARRVAALAMRPVDIDQSQPVLCTRVARVGRNAVMLTRVGGESTVKPEPIPETWLDRTHLTSLVVYTDTGERLGTVGAAHIDPLTLEVQSYELRLRSGAPGCPVGGSSQAIESHGAAEMYWFCARTSRPNYDLPVERMAITRPRWPTLL